MSVGKLPTTLHASYRQVEGEFNNPVLVRVFPSFSKSWILQTLAVFDWTDLELLKSPIRVRICVIDST